MFNQCSKEVRDFYRFIIPMFAILVAFFISNEAKAGQAIKGYESKLIIYLDNHSEFIQVTNLETDESITNALTNNGFIHFKIFNNSKTNDDGTVDLKQYIEFESNDLMLEFSKFGLRSGYDKILIESQKKNLSYEINIEEMYNKNNLHNKKYSYFLINDIKDVEIDTFNIVVADYSQRIDISKEVFVTKDSRVFQTSHYYQNYVSNLNNHYVPFNDYGVYFRSLNTKNYVILFAKNKDFIDITQGDTFKANLLDGITSDVYFFPLFKYEDETKPVIIKPDLKQVD